MNLQKKIEDAADFICRLFVVAGVDYKADAYWWTVFISSRQTNIFEGRDSFPCVPLYHFDATPKLLTEHHENINHYSYLRYGTLISYITLDCMSLWTSVGAWFFKGN
jgi:hypothetical protein